MLRNYEEFQLWFKDYVWWLEFDDSSIFSNSKIKRKIGQELTVTLRPLGIDMQELSKRLPDFLSCEDFSLCVIGKIDTCRMLEAVRDLICKEELGVLR